MKRPLSESDVVIHIAKAKEPCRVVIGYIEERQEIHVGEKRGVRLWNMAIQNQRITVHAKYEKRLFDHGAHYGQYEHLLLSNSTDI